ncbi:hypothetical protein CAPTEDRAFT_212532 [Capitella teleta]|uniref:UPAR/Ly6 domain-containing protein n=1 Tax=Capitella teleta TaxID=283909 RepID=R7TEJ0_CAPTE|nr:hypothetical protein CAPTEDRAFT_212532 [Capitella teleta]|eukprot:ELT89481.1 hypothetical protein CAPTEDRAFT_212532 [Capitella teleta]
MAPTLAWFIFIILSVIVPTSSHKVVIECFECSWQVTPETVTSEIDSEVCGPTVDINAASTKTCDGICKKVETFISSDLKTIERSCQPSCHEYVTGDKVTSCCHNKDLCNTATKMRFSLLCLLALAYATYGISLCET